MNPDIAEAIGPLIAILSIGTFTLVGMKIWLTAKNERLRHGGGGGEHVARLAEAVRDLEDQVVATREEVAELHERVDFAERLLARAEQDPARLDRPAPPA